MGNVEEFQRGNALMMLRQRKNEINFHKNLLVEIGIRYKYVQK